MQSVSKVRYGVGFGPRILAVFYFMDFCRDSFAMRFHLAGMARQNISFRFGAAQSQGMGMAEYRVFCL